MNRTVVILLSDKRSGSTMLQDELCKHPDIQRVAYSPHTYFETHHWLKAAVLLGMPPQTFYGHKVYPGYGSRKNARTYLIDCIRGNVPDFRIPNDDRQLVFEGWEALCSTFARPVFFEKTPHHIAQWAALSLMLEWIRSTQFRVRVIGLIRNPHAVLSSARKLFLTAGEFRQYGWADMYRNLLAFKAMLPEDTVHLVRYEEIVAQPQTVMERICEFVGVSVREEIGQSVSREPLDKWKRDARHSIRLHESVKQVGRVYGYSDEELENDGGVHSSRWGGVAQQLLEFLPRRWNNFIDRHAKPFVLRRRA